jgi:hypothetical protein
MVLLLGEGLGGVLPLLLLLGGVMCGELLRL